jgi:sugar/nucleoside kinase (ribokinase family)
VGWISSGLQRSVGVRGTYVHAWCTSGVHVRGHEWLIKSRHRMSSSAAEQQGERRQPDVVSVLTGAVKLMGEDVEKLVAFAQQKATEVTNVEAHMQTVGRSVAIAKNVAAAAADDAKKGAEAGISKKLDTAKNAADVSAHLGKAKQVASEKDASATRSAGEAAGGLRPQQLVLGQSMHMAAPRVHVVGNTVVDLLVKGSASAGSGKREDGFSNENVQVLSEPVVPALGGSGAASAFVLGKLGVKVRLHTNIGSDAFGGMLTHWLQEAGVTVASPPAAASATHVIHLLGNKRSSSYYRGHKVPWRAAFSGRDFGEGDWWLASGYGAVGKEDLEELTVAVHLLNERCLVAFDPGPWFVGRFAPVALCMMACVRLAPSGRMTMISTIIPTPRRFPSSRSKPLASRRVEREAMLKLFSRLNVLTATQEELRAWVGGSKAKKLDAIERKIFDKSQSSPHKSNKEDSDGEDLAKQCLALCPRAMLVVVKRGASGASWAAPLQGNDCVESGSVKAHACEAVNTVGAGDTFNAQLVYGLASGLAPGAAVKMAVERATRAVRSGKGALGAFEEGDEEHQGAGGIVGGEGTSDDGSGRSRGGSASSSFSSETSLS